MQKDILFYMAWIALSIEVLWAMNTTRLAKKRNLHSAMIVPAATAFVAFHVCWWMSTFKPGENIAAYVFGTVASVAFLFGTSFVSTGCLKLTNKGELCINQDNRVFQLFKKIPIKFEGRSLCSISWLAALCIFLMPVVMGIIGVVCAAITLIVCSFTLQNPFAYFGEIMRLEGWPDTEMKSKCGFPLSPMPYLAVLIPAVVIIWLVARYLPIVAIFVVMLFAFYLISLFFSVAVVKKWDAMELEQQKKVDTQVYDTINSINTKDISVFGVWALFWQVFKKKFCPSIKYCDKQEMRNN